MSPYTVMGVVLVASAAFIWLCAASEHLRRLHRDLADALADADMWEAEAYRAHQQAQALETCVDMLDAELFRNPLGTRGSA